MYSHFLRSLQNFFYYHSFIWLIVALAGFIIIWGLIEYWLHKHPVIYTVFNILAFGLSVFVIISSTLFYRSSQSYAVSFVPFSLFVRSFSDPIIFMSLVMNVVVFIPFGLFGACLFRCDSKKSAVIIISSGFAFSVLIELIQYALSIGNTEVDDVICNTLGITLGYLFYYLYDRYIIQKKSKD